MTKNSVDEARKRRAIQTVFWSQVGPAEHINLPKLEAAIKKEFLTDNGRFIEAQVHLMQTEGRIRIQNKSKVWVRVPEEAP